MTVAYAGFAVLVIVIAGLSLVAFLRSKGVDVWPWNGARSTAPGNRLRQDDGIGR